MPFLSKKITGFRGGTFDFRGEWGEEDFEKKILQHLKRSGKEFMCDKLDIMNALLFNWKKSALFISWGGGGKGNCCSG